MAMLSFRNEDFLAIGEALDIAEDKTGDFFKFSFGQWKRHHYDVKTQTTLSEREISPDSFALLHKCPRILNNLESRTKKRDFYFICLQDHQILKALRRDRDLDLIPLLIYVFTHELVHIVRFCNFHQRFEISGKDRGEEERLVHAITFEILKNIPLKNLDFILESYQGHRICDLATS
jgi:hypothetical protein